MIAPNALRRTVCALASVWVALLVTVLIVAPAWAGTTGKIAGRVTDRESGEGLPSANVIVSAEWINGQETPMARRVGASTNLSGEYFILNMRPGVYTVEVSYVGYRTETRRRVQVTVDRTTTLNFALGSEAVLANEVVVTAQNELVVRDLTASSQKVSGADIAVLPVENVSEVVALQAGVTTDIGGGLHIRGGRSDEVTYYVDGIAVSNPFSNSGLAVPVPTNSVQELEVISGTFNAEYGQALSGVVNIVSKEGGDRLTGAFSAYFGDQLSSRDGLFPRIGRVNLLPGIGPRLIGQRRQAALTVYDGAIGGPIRFLTPKLRFYVNGRYTANEGYFYGVRRHRISDRSNLSGTNLSLATIEATGDSTLVALNPNQQVQAYGKLNYDLTPALRFSYSLNGNDTRYRNYNHYQRFNPDFEPWNFSRSYNHTAKATLTTSPSTFYTLTGALYQTRFDRASPDPDGEGRFAVFANPFDPETGVGDTSKLDSRYQYQFAAGYGRVLANMFSTGGVNVGQTHQFTRTYALRGDVTSQLNTVHLVKAGLDLRRHELRLQRFTIPFDVNTQQIYLPSDTTDLYDFYQQHPVELAAYVQDKMEFGQFIVNAGVRVDYFNSRALVPTDYGNPHNDPIPGQIRTDAEAFSDAKAQWSVSPRIGLAFPLTERGVVHASFGQFFQMPEFSRLYENPGFKVFTADPTVLIGNANLAPQRTAMGEIGLQQELTRQMSVDVTVFYRDIRNLLGSSLRDIEGGSANGYTYGVFTNTDFGTVRGITTSLNVGRGGGTLSAGIDYTYQVAKGNSSDPTSALLIAQLNRELGVTGNDSTLATRQLVPLNWDLRHTINGFVTIRPHGWFDLGIVGKFLSGYPRTPVTGYSQFDTDFRRELQNAERLVSEFRLDLRIERGFTFAGVRTGLFLKVNNLLDSYRPSTLPQLSPESIVQHEAAFTALRNRTVDPFPVNSLYDIRYNPASQPVPREVRLGATVSF